MKKGLLLLILAILIAGTAFTQEKYDGSFHNTVMARLALLGGGISYELAINQNFSVGAEANYELFLIALTNYGVDVFARWYPKGRIFYTELGLGYGGLGTILADADAPDGYLVGFLVKPGIGWKIDVGLPGGFMLQPAIAFPMVFGKFEKSNKPDAFLSYSATLGLGCTF